MSDVERKADSGVDQRPDRPPQWLVVQSKPMQERVAASNLTHRGVETYLPLFLEPPWHRRAPRGPMPLFPGYVFVTCDIQTQLSGVRFCPAVSRVVSFGRDLAFVDDSLIQSLRELEEDRGFIVPETLHKALRKGQRVRIMDGPFKGLEGVFQGYLRGSQRALVLIDFLRRQQTIELGVNDITRCA